MNDDSNKSPVAPDGQDSADTPHDEPALQGEGNYTAARRHRKSVEKFIDNGKVEPAARRARPDSPEQERELKDAEDTGLEHGRR